jgi:hypothetical protein
VVIVRALVPGANVVVGIDEAVVGSRGAGVANPMEMNPKQTTRTKLAPRKNGPIRRTVEF